MVNAFEVLDAQPESSRTAPPRFPALVDPDEARLRAAQLDQLVREHTAGKGYRPNRSLCAHCILPVSSREPAAWRAESDGTLVVYHARCAP